MVIEHGEGYGKNGNKSSESEDTESVERRKIGQEVKAYIGL